MLFICEDRPYVVNRAPSPTFTAETPIGKSRSYPKVYAWTRPIGASSTSNAAGVSPANSVRSLSTFSIRVQAQFLMRKLTVDSAVYALKMRRPWDSKSLLRPHIRLVETCPDENRWNIDGGKPDSFASRLTLSAGNNFSGQFSIGRINNREAVEPDLDTLRTTASIHHNVRFSSGHVSTSLIWGRNKDLESHGTRIFNGYTAESTVNFLSQNWAWTRIENVDR